MENTTTVVNTEKNLTTTTIVTVKNGSIAESETTQEIDPNLTYIEKLQLKYKCCLLDWIIVLFCKKGKLVSISFSSLEKFCHLYKISGLLGFSFSFFLFLVFSRHLEFFLVCFLSFFHPHNTCKSLSLSTCLILTYQKEAES